MCIVLPYDRTAATDYAYRWALSRNPLYADFTNMGGDCANFISQCLMAGGGIMNDTLHIGWYYRSLSDRAPAWSGVKFLHRFLTRSSGAGIIGQECTDCNLSAGDIIFLHNGSRLYHSLFVLVPSADPLIAAHTVDSRMRPLSSYETASRIFVHITGIILKEESSL